MAVDTAAATKSIRIARSDRAKNASGLCKRCGAGITGLLSRSFRDGELCDAENAIHALWKDDVPSGGLRNAFPVSVDSSESYAFNIWHAGDLDV
jgi:hypothetical protein